MNENNLPELLEYLLSINDTPVGGMYYFGGLTRTVEVNSNSLRD